MDSKSENNEIIAKSKKESSTYFSPNFLDISTLKIIKESFDSLYDDEKSQFSQLIFDQM